MDASDIPDDSVCYICNKPGLIIACDKPGCNKTMHWYCNDAEHQPTSDEYYCTGCREELGLEHPPHAHLRHECVVCHVHKSAAQFVKTRPECLCPGKNNRACAECAYKIVDFNSADPEKCKCPTCRQRFTEFVLPATAKAPEQVIALRYQPANAAADDDDDADADARLQARLDGDDDDVEVAPAAPAFDLFGGAPVLPASNGGDDDDDDDDPDYVPDADSVVGDVAPAGRLGTARGAGSSAGVVALSDDDDDGEPAPKRRTGPAKNKVILVRKEQCPTADVRPHKNPKKGHGYLIMGTLPNLITDEGHTLSSYDSDSHRNHFLKQITYGFDGDDLTDPTENDPDAVAAHCFVLMFRCGYQLAETGSSSLTKHHKRIRALMTIDHGLMGKSQFKESFEAVARSVAERVATEDLKSPSLQTPHHKIVKNYMSAFKCYCKMLLKEQAGEINAKLP